MKKRSFTLMEVVISMTILSIALVASMRLSSAAVIQSQEGIINWERTHFLTQAAEFALTVGPNQMNAMPSDIFYTGDYAVYFSLISPDNPPSTIKLDESETVKRRLQTIRIEMVDRFDNSRETLEIDQLVYTGEGEAG